MLEIHYLKNGSKEIATVESPERFLAVNTWKFHLFKTITQSKKFF